MIEYTFRTADPDDLIACHTVESLCFPPSEAAWTSSLRNRIEEYPEGFLVVEKDGRIIGQCNSGCTYKDDITDEDFKQLIGHDPDGPNMVIFSLSVLPEHQSNGVGGELLKKFLARARKLDKKQVFLLCKNELVGFYEKYGFVDNGVSGSTHGGAKWHEMVQTL